MIWDTESFCGEIEPQWSLSSDRSAKIKICRFQLLINLPRSGCWPDPLITNKLSLQQIEQRLCSLSREIDRSFCILLRNKLSLFRRFCNPRITPSTSKMQGSTKMMTAVSAGPCWQELTSTHTRLNEMLWLTLWFTQSNPVSDPMIHIITLKLYSFSSLPVLSLEKSLLIFYWLGLKFTKFGQTGR